MSSPAWLCSTAAARSTHRDFPNFAKLARESTWFDNATANAEATTRAIPVIVTGNFPQGYDPSDAAYPHNLFRLLAPEYEVTIHEVETRFCTSPEYHCPDAQRVSSKKHLLRAVAEALPVAYRSSVRRSGPGGRRLAGGTRAFPRFPRRDCDRRPAASRYWSSCITSCPTLRTLLTPDGAVPSAKPQQLLSILGRKS